MGLLSDAIQRLEAALVQIGHPLADTAVRPVPRTRESTQQAAQKLLGHPLPDELVELWEWWGGGYVWPGSEPLRGTACELPGGAQIVTLEDAIEFATASLMTSS